MFEPTRVPNEEFLTELKCYVDDIPEGLAGAFGFDGAPEPFAVVFGKEAWDRVVTKVNHLEDQLAQYSETISVLDDSVVAKAYLASLDDDELAEVFSKFVIDNGTRSMQERASEYLSPGVKNFMDGPTYEGLPGNEAQPFRQIGEGEYRDMQRRITNQRKQNYILEEKYAEVTSELDDLKVRFGMLEESHTYFAGQAEFYRHEYDKLVGAVNAVRAINIKAL